MFDHDPVEKESIRTPSEVMKKQRSSLLMRLAIHALSGDVTVPESPPSKAVLEPLRVDEERFGKAPESLKQPLLAGNQGKLSRKKRKAARAS